MLEKISKDFVIDHRTRHVKGLTPFSHSHQFNEIYFLQSGKCHVYIENENIPLKTEVFCLFLLLKSIHLYIMIQWM